MTPGEKIERATTSMRDASALLPIMARPPRALIADDQPDVLEALRLLLKTEGYQLDAVTSPAAVLAALQANDYDVLLMDLNYARDTTSGQEGLDLLTQIQALDRTLPIIVMTAWGSIELAVEAMRRGVRDFVQKPWDNAHLLNTLRQQVELGQTQRKQQRLATEEKTLSREILQLADRQLMLKLVAEQLQQVLPTGAVIICTKAPRDHSFWVTAQKGISDEVLGRVKFSAASQWLAALDDIRPVRESELTAEDALTLQRLNSQIVVPIKFNGELVGLIGVGEKLAATEYDARDREFLSAIAAQLGVGINNFRVRSQDQEFEEAREIQQGLLPKQIPQLRGYELASAWRPARAVSGDYYDVIKFSETEAAICIADVTGKGLPAALLMSNLQASVKAFASAELAPRELCEKVNRVVCANLAAGKFITFFYCLLAAPAQRLVYVNAGHNGPIVARRDGVTEQLTTGGAVLGVFPEWNFEQGEVSLNSGDRVLLFTDGVTEGRNAAGEEFGEERLINLLRANRALSAAELQQKIMAEVADFSGESLHDDATLIVLAVE